MTTSHVYGIDAIEFYPHNDAELQELVKRKEVAYFRNCQSPAYPDLGVNVAWVSEEPLTPALNDLTGWLVQGYTVATSLCKPLYLSLQLKKPSTIVDGDLLELVELAKVEYTASRYARNVEETKRQIEITIEKRARDAAKAEAKAAVEHREAEEAYALADLLKAYSPKTTTKVKQEVAA
jgi:hypothetical protein